MANIFDTNNALPKEPERISVGDFVQWRRADLSADYPPADYTLTFVGRINAGSQEIKVVATTDNSQHLFTITSTASDSYAAGTYEYQIEVEQTSSGNRAVVDSGQLTVAVDLDADNADARTHAEVMVAKIQTVLEGKADSDVSSYSIAGRSITKMSFNELVEARDFYRKEVVQYRNEMAVKNGKKGTQTIKVRF